MYHIKWYGSNKYFNIVTSTLHGVVHNNTSTSHGVVHNYTSTLHGVVHNNTSTLHGVVHNNTSTLHGMVHNNTSTVHDVVHPATLLTPRYLEWSISSNIVCITICLSPNSQLQRS